MEVGNFDLKYIQDPDNFKARYRPCGEEVWQGRTDGNEDADLRWHQHIQRCHILQHQPLIEFKESRTYGLIGFACDEGVRRNQGRTGAAQGPYAIRKALSNLPVHEKSIRILDLGNIHCEDGGLENAQDALADLVNMTLRAGVFPIVLGGGHEVTYGHAKGILKFIETSSVTPVSDQPPLKTLNIDAHFDNREPGEDGATSGTGFFQLQGKVQYYAWGIQHSSNTARLFQRARNSGTRYLLAEDFPAGVSKERFFQNLLDDSDPSPIYLTIDLDAFAAPFAPGVSAPGIFGLVPDAQFLQQFDQILDSGKVISVDFAELCPSLDLDQRTARLAAALIFRIVNDRKY